MPRAKHSLGLKREPTTRPFTGREELVRGFADTLGKLTSGQPGVLVYYGFGEMGKSRLIRRLRNETLACPPSGFLANIPRR